MKFSALMIIMPVLSLSAMAETSATDIDRNVNQQERIEQGLKSGSLNTQEAARLEHQEARVDNMQAKALKDGSVSSEEAARIKNAQDHVSSDIYKQKHDTQIGNPDSASSKRLQADVQRNANQQARIQQGVSNGTLSAEEASKLEHKQAKISNGEALAGMDGHVGEKEQKHIQHQENRNSKKIHREKHD